jgi:hypothetical protein
MKINTNLTTTEFITPPSPQAQELTTPHLFNPHTAEAPSLVGRVTLAPSDLRLAKLAGQL